MTKIEKGMLACGVGLILGLYILGVNMDHIEHTGRAMLGETIFTLSGIFLAILAEIDHNKT